MYSTHNERKSVVAERFISTILMILKTKKLSENFAARLAQANLASKNDIADFVKKIDFDDKLKNLNKKNPFK